MRRRTRVTWRGVVVCLVALGVGGVVLPDGEKDPTAGQEAQPNVTLVQDPAPVARGKATTFRVEGAPPGSHYASWRFVSANPQGTVNRVDTNDVSTWPGILVLDGIVSVEVTLPTGEKKTPQTAACYTPRGWRIPFPDQAREITPGTPFESFVDTVPPGNYTTDGTGYFLAGLSIRQLQVQQVNDNGPNRGIAWVPGDNPAYTLSADFEVNTRGLLSPRLTQLIAQTANMQGVVDATVHHEAGQDQSHFADFRDSYNQILQNPEAGSPRAAGEDPGAFIERQVGYNRDAVLQRVRAASRFGEAVMGDYRPKGEANAFPIPGYTRAGHHEIVTDGITAKPGTVSTTRIRYVHRTLPAAVAPVTFTSVNGPKELQGLSIAADGTLTFRATAPGTYQVTVQSRDTVNGAVRVNDTQSTAIPVVVSTK